MKALRRSMILAILAAVFLAASVQQASAQGLTMASAFGLPAQFKILLGTTGACFNEFPGGPCTQTSTLVLINPQTGKLIKKIGPVGYTVNGLAWDQTSGKLYASTAIGCGETDPNTGFVSPCPFHGLITINPLTGKGKPVNKNAVNFGLPGNPSPIHSITIDPFGHMVGWYDEFGVGASDTYVRINQRTGVAIEFNDTGIDTSQNGVAFGEFNLLWNIDTPRGNPLTQTAYILNPFDGKPFDSILLTPPTPAALGDFLPGTNRYYGLNFPIPRAAETHIVTVDFDLVNKTGTVKELGRTVDDLHTLAFIP
jgi:hypothetical protein